MIGTQNILLDENILNFVAKMIEYLGDFGYDKSKRIKEAGSNDSQKLCRWRSFQWG